MTLTTITRALPRRLALAGLLLMVMLTAAACFQSDGDTLQATSVSMIATFTPPPTETPDAPPTETPIQLIAVTNTPDPLAQAQTDVARAQAQQAFEVVDPFASTATAMALGIGLSQPIDLPLGLPEDPLLQTATAMAGGFLAGPTIDPLFMTATAYIQGATQTAAAPMTQTMEAMFPSTATLPVFATSSTTLPGGTCAHTVAAGENLFRISLRYNTTIDAIASANGIVNPALISVGQSLTIPNCGGASGGTTTTPTGNAQAGERTHTVRQGESLFQISLTYNVPVNSIAARNGLSNPNLIFINQQLIIPAS